MGLNTSHGAWDGSYSSFNRFRVVIARTIGLDLEKMDGFVANGISWEGVKDDLKYLLNHSDCDGHIPPGQCKKIAIRLREIAPLIPTDDWVHERVLQFAKGCEMAHKQKKNLEFH